MGRLAASLIVSKQETIRSEIAIYRSFKETMMLSLGFIRWLCNSL
jgi:hypothetical protein